MRLFFFSFNEQLFSCKCGYRTKPGRAHEFETGEGRNLKRSVFHPKLSVKKGSSRPRMSNSPPTKSSKEQ